MAWSALSLWWLPAIITGFQQHPLHSRWSIRTAATRDDTTIFDTTVGGALTGLDTGLNAELSIVGTLPAWLCGGYIRNGPGRWTPPGTDDDEALHLFDGFAMIWRFELDGQRQYAACRSAYLETETWKYAKRQKSRLFNEFGTPVSNMLHFARGMFAGAITDNAVVSITQLADGRCIACTETVRGCYEFDRLTLETKGRWQYEGNNVGFLQTAHATQMEGHHFINVGTSLAPPRYTVFTLDSAFRTRRILTHIKPTGAVPSWMHAFAATDDFCVLLETPAIYDVSALAGIGKGQYVALNWAPDQGTWLHVVALDTGEVTTLQAPENFFFIHVANTGQFTKDTIWIDICTFDDPSIVSSLLLRNMRDPHRDLPRSRLRRLHIDLVSKSSSFEVLCDTDYIEFPAINDALRGQSTYRSVYSIGIRERPSALVNVITKSDTHTGTTQVLRTELEYATIGEPIFVRRPDGTHEDDGVVLTIANTFNGQAHLLVFDAQALTEVARVIVPAPGVPYGFHGVWDPAHPEA